MSQSARAGVVPARLSAGRVVFVDVPERTFLTLRGQGAPEDPAFAEAVAALVAVSSAARFAARRRTGVSSRVAPLEALWSSEAPAAGFDLVAAVALGLADVRLTDRARWRWQAMIALAPGVDGVVLDQAVAAARERDVPLVDDITVETWHEGRTAQLLHTGSYAGAARAVARLHDAIEAAGYRPVGQHHEIYLTDPVSADRNGRRIVLRRPIAPA